MVSKFKSVSQKAKSKLTNLFIILIFALSGAVPFLTTQNVFATGPTDAYVSTTGSGTACTSAAPCDNFADALSVVTAGGTVHVANGTYTESFNVTTSDIVIQSDHGKNHVTINGLETVNADNVTITGFTFTNPSGTGSIVVHNSGYSAIENNNFDTVGTGYGGSNAVQAVYIEGSSSNATVAHNNFTNIGSSTNTSSNKAIFVGDSTAGTTSNVSIFDNSINGVTGNPSPWGSGGHGAYGVLVNHEVTDLLVSGNNIKNLDGLWAHAIGLESNTPSAVVTNNIVKNLTDHKGGIDSPAVQLESNPSAPFITLTGNKLDGHLLTLSKSYVPVDQTWSPLSPAPAANIYPEVYFHGKYYFYGINAFSDINDGMTAVDSSGTVEVESGSYPNVDATSAYNSNILVEGWHNTKPIINGLHLTGATFDGLTFKGFEFEGDSNGYSNSSVNIDGDGSYANLTFMKDVFDGQSVPERFAFFANRGFDGLTFQDNSFKGYDGSPDNSVYSVVFAEAQGSSTGNHYTATDNKLRHSTASNFFEAYRWQNVSYTHNNVNASLGRLLVWSNDSDTLGSVDINDNTVKTHGGTGIGVYYTPGTTLTADSNYVKGADSCVKIDSVTDSTVTGSTFDHCSTRGLLFSQNASTAPSSASISGNTFSNGPVGVENATTSFVLDACDNTFTNITTDLYSNPGPFNKVKCEIPSASLTANNNGHYIPSGGATNSEYFTFNLTGAPDADHYRLKYWNDISGSPFNGEAHAWSPSNINSYSTSPAQLGVYVDHFTQGEGTHYFKFSACDSLGNCSDYSTPPYEVIYDTTRPTVSFTSPSSFSTPFSTGPTVTVNASDALSGLGSLVIHVYDDSNTLLSTCGSANSSELAAGSMSCDLSSLPDGTYHIKAGAFDKAGNNKTISSGDFVIDGTPPAQVAGMTIKVNGNDVGCGASINQRTITVDWDNSTDINFDHYQYQADADKVFPYDYTTTVASSQRTGTIRDQDGTYNYRVRAIDSAGNIGAWSDWCSVTLDRQAPTITVDSQSTTNVNPTVTGTIDDNTATPLSVTVNGHTYTATVSSTTNLGGTYDWSADVTDILPVGTYDVVATATDPAGNAGSDTTTDELTINSVSSFSGPTPSTFSAASIQGGNTNGNNGGNGGGAGGAGGGQVLGANTNTPNTKNDSSDGGSVKGDSTSNANKNDNNHSNFLGLGWWWLLVLAILALIFGGLLRSADNTENSAK